MKLSKLNLNLKAKHKKQALEDMRYLQRKISGKSVYANIRSVYKRTPKHRHRAYASEFNALRGN